MILLNVVKKIKTFTEARNNTLWTCSKKEHDIIGNFISPTKNFNWILSIISTWHRIHVKTLFNPSICVSWYTDPSLFSCLWICNGNKERLGIRRSVAPTRTSSGWWRTPHISSGSRRSSIKAGCVSPLLCGVDTRRQSIKTRSLRKLRNISCLILIIILCLRCKRS